MNLHEWQANVEVKLRSLATSARQLTPGVLYGALSTATIFPLVEAARQAIGAQNYPLLMTLGALAAGIGGNLVAEQISRWHDRTEEELAQELSQKAATDEAWRKALDDLLERFDALRVVQTVMSEADKDWFAQTMRRALQEVGSRLTIQVCNLTGNTGVAIGEQITQIINIYRQPDETLDAAALEQQIRHYLAWVADRFGKIALLGVEYRGRNVINLDLEQVYVPLQATTRRRQATRQRRHPSPPTAAKVTGHDDEFYEEQTVDIPLDQLLGLAPQLVVTGGPGCGKTTVLQHIAWTLALALAENPTLATEKLGLVVETATDGEKASRPLPLPLYVPLSRYVNYRRELRQRGRPAEPHKTTLLNFISHYMIERGMAPRLPADFFVRLLEQGDALLLLLDGLDEVPNDEERRHVCTAIQDLVAGKRNLRVVVTCRTAAYKGETMLDDTFQPVQVKPLQAEQVTALLTQAFACIEPHDETTRQEKLTELTVGIQGFEAERAQRMGDRYQRLIDSPLMVRLLLLVFLTGRGFPKQRADLYERATQALLQPNYTLDDEVARQIGELVGGHQLQHRNLLEYLAFQMHEAGETQGREQSHDDLSRLLNQEATLAPLADAFLALTRVRGGLMEERLGSYRFFHLAFQEYLTACYLAKTRLGEGGVDGVAAFLEAGPMLDSWWREPALLITGHFVSSNDLTNARRFVRRLAGVTPSQKQSAPLSPDLQLVAAEIAQLSCLEWLENDVVLRQELRQRTAALLTNARLMKQSKPPLRAAAAALLGQLGDPRPGVGVKNGLPDLAWSKVIDPGPFIMGDDKGEYDDEKPQFTCNLITESYRISRYPITVAQYNTFIEAGGYNQRQYWTKAGWQWREKEQIVGPKSYRAVFQTPNHPQVGISWYEAVAFCKWLTIMVEYEVRLPTEAEWERATRHTDGRNYPWGAKFNADRCNINDSGIGSTSAVGLFPNGNALCGAADMSGNVWEWCSTQWLSNYEKYQERVKEDLEGDSGRVLRGGSFGYDDGYARCACRSYNFPRYRYDDFGFRVLLPGSVTLVSENSEL